MIEFKKDDIYSTGFCLMMLSILFFFICIVSVGGLPILRPSLRYSLKPAFSMIVFLIVPATSLIACTYMKDFQIKKITRHQVRFRFFVLLLINAIILLTLGYRTPLLASFIIIIMIGFFGNIVSIWEIVLAALIGISLIVGIGYFRQLTELSITTATSPLNTLRDRIDFTLHVLNLLDFLGGDFGLTHGNLLAHSLPGSEFGPRRMVGKLIAWRSEVTLTPTLLGQMVVDFGKVGVAIEMCILGFILGIGFKIVEKTNNYFFIGLYSLILTYSIIGIETGILDIQVIGYFLISLFIYMLYIVKERKYKKSI